RRLPGGEGDARPYRALVKTLAARGHEVSLLERELPFHAEDRNVGQTAHASTYLYSSLEELYDRFGNEVRDADLVVVGSYVPDGAKVGSWVLALAPGRAAFYDIDTPATLAQLSNGSAECITREQIPRYGLYLAGSGGRTLQILRRDLGSPCARPL